jgi:hypothetical protein
MRENGSMKFASSNPSASTTPQTAASRPLTLAATGFLLGAVLAGAWFYHQRTSVGAKGGLPVQTQDMLGHLAAPVTIRFYSLLPATSADADLSAFSGRVAQLLAAVQQAGAGQITVASVETVADTNAAAASAAGLQPFNLDKGDACYLGLVISSDKKKEAIARLQPEWESALPFDLVRAILRVAAAAAPAPLPPEVAKPSAATISSIQTLIPDVNAVTSEQADQIFHAQFLKECGEAGAETEKEIAAAQQQVEQAQSSGSAEQLAAAQKNLQQVQLAAGQKMKQIAADLQTRLAVFQQLKAGTAK